VGSEWVSGPLTLFDDGTYTFDDDAGDEGDFSGIWLEEGKKIQLFQEAPTVREQIAELEQAARDEGLNLRVTSLVEKETIKLTKTGDIKIKGKTTWRLRPGLQGNKPLKITSSGNLIGLRR
jgi:hypothetical protein